MPANTKPVQPFTAERHIDLQGDLQFCFDWLLQGKRVLDVGAGLGRSKARIRHNHVTTYEPSPACREFVDLQVLPTDPYEVVTAFEVLEHVKDDLGFLRQLDALATQAVFLTTPNWHVARCQSAQHYREYVHDEFWALLKSVWPRAPIAWMAYYKDAEGGWVELPDISDWYKHTGLKHVALIYKELPYADQQRIVQLFGGRWTTMRRRV